MGGHFNNITRAPVSGFWHFLRFSFGRLSSLLSVLVLLTYNLQSQDSLPKELGIGLAIAIQPYLYEDPFRPPTLFRDSELSIPWGDEKVTPYYYRDKYWIYHLICLEKGEKYLKVLVNNSKVGYVPFSDSTFYFQSWEALLVSTKVRRLTNDNPIRRGYSDDDEIVPYDCIKESLTVCNAVEKGGNYWIEVMFSPRCRANVDEFTRDLTYGWIKWKREEELLVEILYL